MKEQKPQRYHFICVRTAVITCKRGMFASIWKRENPSTQMIGMHIGELITENAGKFSQPIEVELLCDPQAPC